MAEQKKPPGEDPLKRLLLEAGAEMDARLRDWIAKSSGKPGITRTRASTGQPSGFPAPSGQRDPGNAESDSSAQRKAA